MNKAIEYSRHAKRRMKLYDISPEDIILVVNSGVREVQEDRTIYFLPNLQGKFRYPIKVVTIESSDSLLIVTAYPLKRAKDQNDESNI